MSDPYNAGIPPVPPQDPYTPPVPPIASSPAPSGEAGLALPSDIKTSAMLCHLLGLAGYVGIPFGSLIGPLIVWLTQKEKSVFIDYHGKESLNFQITMFIAAVICIPFFFVIIGIFMLIAVGIYGLVMTILASIKTSEGAYYRYPFTLRLIK